MLRDFLDEVILVADNGLRVLSGNHERQIDTNKFPQATKLTEKNRRTAAKLMRINHCGEICAQALYEGQALTARSDAVRKQLKAAATEERQHLAICETRLNELDARPSLLEPLFYAASVTMGALVGGLGDRTSLGFVEATEDEVCNHLERHIHELDPSDTRTLAMLESIRDDEAQHQAIAVDRGGRIFASPIKSIMALAAKVMTRSTAQI